MVTENKYSETNIDQRVLAADVDSTVIEGVRKGEIGTIVLDINEQNQQLILKTVDGHLILRTDEMPVTYRGCYLYNGDDWAGTTKRRCYVDMVCQNAAEPGDVPFLSLERLKEAIPDYNWEEGHSGEVLPEDVRERLDELWRNG